MSTKDKKSTNSKRKEHGAKRTKRTGDLETSPTRKSKEQSKTNGGERKLNNSGSRSKKNVTVDQSKTANRASQTPGASNTRNEEGKPNLDDKQPPLKEKSTPAVETTLELEDIVQDKATLLLFRDYLHEIYSGENLAFWLETELYKSLPVKKRPSRAKEIYSLYLDANNPHSRLVNVDNKAAVEEIKQNLDNGDENLFVLSQNRIWGLLKLESYPRFIRNCEAFHNYVKAGLLPKPSKEKRDALKRSTTVANMNEFLKKLKEQIKKTGEPFKPATFVEFPKEVEDEEENLYDQPDVEEILDDKELLLAFREFLYTTYANENLAFWLEAELYRQIKDKAEMNSRCQQIYDKFCKTDSDQAINLDWSTQNKLANEVKKPGSKTFEVAQQEIWKVLKNEWFPEFCLSQHFKDLEAGTLEFKRTKTAADAERRNTVFSYDELYDLRKQLGIAN